MAKTLYKEGRTTSNYAQSKLQSYLDAGWSLTAPTAPSTPSASTPSTSPNPTPSAPAQDTSHQTVYKDGKSTIVQAWEVSDYLSRGYTSS